MPLTQRTDFSPRLSSPRPSSSFTDRLPELPPARLLILDFTNRPILAAVYKVSGLAIVILGPTFWAALIALFVVAELPPN